ncbi:AvrD family protein [Sporolactobacillus sp. CQH2019]|uniref:AvrD family protein n=1 Tax=Sporolactobacillus sp. CQH2019 TaxID=3023512 RepID=UPI003FD57C2A
MMTNYTVDQLLGDHEKRYFGNGYKKVTHKLCQLRLSNGIWECFGQVKRVKTGLKKTH